MGSRPFCDGGPKLSQELHSGLIFFESGMSLSISVDFQLEIKKLFGINSVNVDIWNRLCTSMVKEGPLFASELAIYLVYPHTRCLPLTLTSTSYSILLLISVYLSVFCSRLVSF